jgi:hypothetical protein
MYLEQLQRKLINFGWYGGRSNLLVLTMEGEFEGFYGRASEAWEHRFSLEIDKIGFTEKPFPGYKIIGRSWKDSWEVLAKQALEYLEEWEALKV